MKTGILRYGLIVVGLIGAGVLMRPFLVDISLAQAPTPQEHTAETVDENTQDPDGEILPPDAVVHAIDPDKTVHRDDPAEPWVWSDPKPEGCSDLGEVKTKLECRAEKGSSELYWYKVTYQDYECKPDMIPERVASYEKTSTRCSKLDYAETRQSVTFRYRKQLDDPNKWPGDDQVIDRPPSGGGGGGTGTDEIFPPRGELRPVWIGICPRGVIWTDEDGHQYLASYDENGAGKWLTGGPTTLPPPSPKEFQGRKIPDCPPPGHASRDTRSSLGGLAIGIGIGAGMGEHKHDDRHEKDDHNSDKSSSHRSEDQPVEQQDH